MFAGVAFYNLFFISRQSSSILANCHAINISDLQLKEEQLITEARTLTNGCVFVHLLHPNILNSTVLCAAPVCNKETRVNSLFDRCMSLQYSAPKACDILSRCQDEICKLTQEIQFAGQVNIRVSKRSH